ncbi:MAG: NAD kinase [Rhodospirillaceae bacterium]|nr:NAD kinase [Rhodospirillaceae bacterium]
MSEPSVAFVATDSDPAQAALASLQERYGQVSPEDADVIVALGGDGYMLETLHAYLPLSKPVFGMHRGSVGFLMNSYEEKDLPARLAKADSVVLHPLKMTTIDNTGKESSELAINEVSMLRESRQAAKLRVSVNGRCRMEELVCDGALVCTPAGSTAYNLSVHGPVLPLGANLLAVTPISAFRPRRWRGAIIPDNAVIKFEVLEADKRPVSAVADRAEVRHVTEVTVREDRDISITLLFDPEHNLEERILAEQFLP